MKPVRSIFALCGRLCLGGAAGIALYLAGVSLAHASLPGCGRSSACLEILQSRWANVAGLPVSFPGFALFCLAGYWSGAFLRRERSVAGVLSGVLLAAVLAAAAWFMVLQVFVLHAFCLLCSVSHGLAASGALLLFCDRMRQSSEKPGPARERLAAGKTALRPIRIAVAATVLTGAGILAFGAMHHQPRRLEQEATVSTDPPGLSSVREPGSITLKSGRYHLNTAQFPQLGEGTAQRTAILLSDYTCSRCRQFHSTLQNLISTNGKSVCIVMLPASSAPDAGKIHQVLLTVFHADKSAWRSLAALITSGQIPAKSGAVKDAAVKLLGADKWGEASLAYAGEVEQQLQLAASMLTGLRSSGGTDSLPQLLCGDRVLTGVEQDPSKLLAFFEKEAPASVPVTGKEFLPSLALLKTSVDLTGIKAGIPCPFEISLRNDGNAPLKLGWLALPPDCEVTSFPTGGIPPGEVAAIGLRLTPPSAEDEFSHLIRIFSNAPGNPGTVTIQGTLETSPPKGASGAKSERSSPKNATLTANPQ